MREDIIFFSHEREIAKGAFEVLMCGTSYCDGSYTIRRPHSPLCCIEYVIKGTGTVRVDNTSFCAAGGDVYILPVGKDHHYSSSADDPWEKVWFNVSGSLAEHLLRCYGLEGVYHVKGLDAKALFDEFLQAASRIRQATVGQPCFDECAVIFLRIAQAIAAHLGTNASQKSQTAAQRLKGRLDVITNFSLSFDEIIREFSFTKSHLIRLFKTEYGITPYEYLLRRKLAQAKLLLENTAMSISEISESLGFCDAHYFCSFFTRRTGMSPRKYRNRGA